MLKLKLHKHLSRLRIKEGDAKGLYKASVGENYQKIWVRDSFYCALPLLQDNPDEYVETIQKLLDFYIMMELKHHKFYWLIKDPTNKASYEYLHPRLSSDLGEIEQPWGFKQHDCFGEVLYSIYLGESAGYKIIRNSVDKHIIKQIIRTLEAQEYWRDADNGIWEEYEEVHASSVGSCVKGLESIRYCGFEVPQYIIDNGKKALNNLLPRESDTKSSDLALLTLIYPFNVVSESMAKTILNNVENELLRERGVIRYKGDKYYNPTGKIGDEAEWCFGIAYLALAHNNIGQHEKANYFYKLLLEKCVVNDGEVPELFYSKTNIYNDNTPLGWSVAMARIAERVVGGIE